MPHIYELAHALTTSDFSALNTIFSMILRRTSPTLIGHSPGILLSGINLDANAPTESSSMVWVQTERIEVVKATLRSLPASPY